MLTDEEFIKCAQQYMDTVFRVAFNYAKNRADADDITQNVFIKLYRASKPFESDAHIKHWLIRVTINEGNECVMGTVLVTHMVLRRGGPMCPTAGVSREPSSYKL